MPRKNLSQQIVKVTGMFGGLQATNIICSIIRTKLIAMWIGPACLGIFALFNTALDTLYSLTQLGLNQSAVRHISVSDGKNRPALIRVVRHWALALGIMGMLLTVALSPLLSKFSFGNTSLWWAFAALSSLVLLSAINAGETAVFQGLQRFRKMGICSITGYIGGLLVSIPMFWFLGVKSILPSIFAYNIIYFMAIAINHERVPAPPSRITISQTWHSGKEFMKLGIFLTVSGLVTNATSYIFNSWLNNFADEAAVGYYQSGFTLVNRYVGIVFTAISMEYFPRLSAVAKSRMRVTAFVANEIILASLLLGPIITLFIAASPLIVPLMFTSEFLVIIPFIAWAAAGTVFRGISWCMAFVIIARGDGRVYMLTEVLSGIICLSLNILCFNKWGIAGLGYSYFAWYVAYTFIIAIVYFCRYRLTLAPVTIHIMLFTLVVAVSAALLACCISPAWALLACFPSCIFSLILLRRKLL